MRLFNTVRIVTPTFVVRVGYPKTLEDYAEDDDDVRVMRFLLGPDFPPFNINAPAGYKREKEKCLNSLRYLRACAAGFGGNERTLHTISIPHLKGVLATVVGGRIVVTGTRIPEAGDGEDFEPATLRGQKSHALHEVATTEGKLWIENTNVEILKPR